MVSCPVELARRRWLCAQLDATLGAGALHGDGTVEEVGGKITRRRGPADGEARPGDLDQVGPGRDGPGGGGAVHDGVEGAALLLDQRGAEEASAGDANRRVAIH